MSVNLNTLASHRTNWPQWAMRGLIKRVDSQGNIIPQEYAFGGQHVRISPRFQRGGTNFRVRPERPAAFFAAWCYEHDLLPVALTPEESESEFGLELLDPLWHAHKNHFYKLESPNAACDQATQPSHRVGFSFCILQLLVEEVGSVRHSKGAPSARIVGGVVGNGENLDGLRQMIEQMRSRATPTAKGRRSN